MMVNLASIQPLPETEEWQTVPRLEDGMWPTGGVVDPEADSGLMNWQAQILARRTKFLRTRVDALIAAVVAASTTVAGIVRLNNTLTSSATDEALTAAQGKLLQTTKAPLASPAFTGTPTAPTAAVATNTTQIATTAFVQAKVAALVNSSPAALDTLYELAAALGNDPNFAATVTNAIAQKAPLASPALTGAPTAPTPTEDDSSNRLATTAFVEQAVETNAIGVGQIPQNFSSAGRSGGVSYQNTTGRTITVAISGRGAGPVKAETSADGTAWVAWGVIPLPGADSAIYGGVTMLVPPEHYYRVSGSFTIQTWVELR